jgi:RNAse (barnase) inhibitor barstar
MIRTLGRHVDVEGLIADAEEEGRAVTVVDVQDSKQATLEAFAEALDFPQWFGANLDALEECLHHVADESEGEREIVVDHAARLQRADDSAHSGLLAVLAEIAFAHPRFHITVLER